MNTVVNWFWTLVVSLVTPYMFDGIQGYTWLVFACTGIIGFIYIFTFMKETKGVPKDRVKRLYNKPDNQVYEPIH